MKRLAGTQKVKVLIFKSTKMYKTQVASYWEFDKRLITFSAV